GPVGPGPVGAGPIGPGPIGPGPVGPGPIGGTPIGPPPMSLPSVGALIGPMMIEVPAMRLAWNEQDRQDREKEAEQRERERETRAYEQARDDLDNGRYDRAIQRFSDAIAMKGAHADAALYFKAWAQNKAGQRAEALATIATLNKEYPKSRYVDQAKSLESEVRSNTGTVRPDQTDDDTKIYALSAVMNADPEKAIPMIEQLLSGNA